jgi:hypothetical protein
MQYERSFKDHKEAGISNEFPAKKKILHYRNDAFQLLHNRQLGRERQLARRVTNVHLLLGAGDDPVLRGHIPVGQVTTGQGRSPLDLLARSNGDTVKGTEDSDRVILTTKGDVL